MALPDLRGWSGRRRRSNAARIGITEKVKTQVKICGISGITGLAVSS